MTDEPEDRSTNADRGAWWILTAALVVWAALVARTNFLIDDAFISFRYARLWAETGVPTYEAAAARPVEGYSNFLWVVLLRLAYGAGFSLETASRVLSLLFAAGTIVLLWAYLRRLALGTAGLAVGCLTLATFPPFVVWSTGGLETASFGFFLLASYLALVRRGGAGRPLSGLLAGGLGLAVALSRVEGFAWVLVVAACAWAANALSPEGVARRKLRFGLFFGVYLLGFGGFLLWRHAVYGEWMANTVQAKAGFSVETLVRGLKTSASFALVFLSPLAILGGALLTLRGAGPRRAAAVGGAGMVLAALGYNTLVGGDWMPFFRFLAPAAPFLALVAALAAACCRASAVTLGGFATVALLPVFGLGLVPRAVLEPLDFRGFVRVGYQTEWERWETGVQNLEMFSSVGRALGQIARPDDSLTFGAIGAIGWYSGLRIHDRNGLVDREVARRPPVAAERSAGHDKQVPRAYFLEREPTLFHAVFAAEPPSPRVEAALLRATVSRVFAGGGEDALRAACLPEVHPIRAEGRTPAGTLMVLRATKDAARAAAYWQRVLGE